MAKLTILMYHKIAENHTDFLTVDTASLINQLKWLKTKFNFIKLSDLVAHITQNKALPINALLITFDDGYENNFNLAYPIFKQFNIPFSIFLISNFIGKKINYDGEIQSFLSIEQLQQMSDLVQFGFHSAKHNNLMNLETKEWASEIREGVNTLKEFPIDVQNIWAYTYGSFPKKNSLFFEQLVHIFQSESIVAALRIGNRKNTVPLKNTFAIERIDVRGDESFFKFKCKVRFGKML